MKKAVRGGKKAPTQLNRGGVPGRYPKKDVNK